MTNEQIAMNVSLLLDRIAKESGGIKPSDADVVKAGVALITNLLQNINTIALAAKEGVFDR